MRKIFVVIVAFIVSSCAYSFIGQGGKIKGDIKSIYIENVVNKTSEPNLQVYLKRDLITVFDLDSRVSVAKSKDLADGFLKVSIVKYDVDPISYAESGLAIRYRCAISAIVDLENSKGEKVINSLTVSDFKDYSASDSVSATEEARSKISKEVLKNLSEKIRDALFVGF